MTQQRKNREWIHSLVRKHCRRIPELMKSEKGSRFLKCGFSRSQLRKCLLYGMILGARKYVERDGARAGKEEESYLVFYALQELSRQIACHSHCFIVNPETGKSSCTVPARHPERRPGVIIFPPRS